MQDERNECASMAEDLDSDPTDGLNRRRLVGAARNFVMGASGLLLPGWIEEAAAREGALDGARGGRRGRGDRGHHRRTHGDRKGKDKGNDKDQDKPRGVCLRVLDMTLKFRNASSRDHLMSVAEGDLDCRGDMTYRWIDKVVPGDKDFDFVGWYPDLHLDLYSVSPYLHFEAQNPRAGYPSMTITKSDPTAPGGRRTILDKYGFFVNERVMQEGFVIERQPDFDEHKVFIIAALA